MSGGFATVQPGSQLSINAVEGYALEDFSADNVRNQISEAQKIANGSGSEQDIAEARIELEVREMVVTLVEEDANNLYRFWRACKLLSNRVLCVDTSRDKNGLYIYYLTMVTAYELQSTEGISKSIRSSAVIHASFSQRL